MSASQDLRRAIDLARAGHTVEARELLLKVVERDERNEAAWIWLSGLVDSLEDKIIACENVLAINPGNDQVRAYLQRLQERWQESLSERNRKEATQLLWAAKSRAQSGDAIEALRLAQQSTYKYGDLEDAWLLVADLTSNTAERMAALERAQEVNPSNPQTRSRLQQARRLHEDPLGAAADLEQVGKIEEALLIYKETAAKARDPREFDRIYRQILRIEALQKEKIRYVAPRTSILRLAVGWPLLYLFLVLVQVGLKPLVHPALHLWLALPLVALGSFLLALSEVRSRHMVWEKVFEEQGDGSNPARLVTAFAGWMLVIFPHLLLLIDSLNRLRGFRIPPEPF